MITDKKSFLAGCMVGCRLREGRPSGVAPTGWMYGSCPVALPKIPEVEGNPYAYMEWTDSNAIVSGSYYSELYLCADPITGTITDRVLGSNVIKVKKVVIPDNCLRFAVVTDEKMLERVTEGMDKFLGDIAYLPEANQWGAVGSISKDDALTRAWTNADIVTEDGTVILQASEPIPVYE